MTEGLSLIPKASANLFRGGGIAVFLDFRDFALVFRLLPAFLVVFLRFVVLVVFLLVLVFRVRLVTEESRNIICLERWIVRLTRSARGARLLVETVDG